MLPTDNEFWHRKQVTGRSGYRGPSKLVTQGVEVEEDDIIDDAD